MANSKIRAGEAFLDLTVRDQAFAAGLAKAEQRLKSLGSAMSNIGRNLAGLGAAVGAPFLAMVKRASDAQETLSKFAALFGEQTKAADAFAKSLASAVGRSSVEIKAGLSSFQAFFVGLGFGAERSRELSQELSKLSIDFASFHNLSDSEAQGRFISALSGSSEVLDQFGVNIKQAAIEQKLFEQEIRKTAAQATEMEKAIARLAIISEAMTSQGAVGDAVRTAGSLSNQMKALKARVSDAAVEIGSQLIPAVTDLVGKAIQTVARLSDFASANRAFTVSLATMAAKAFVAGTAIFALGKAFQALALSIGGARKALALLVAHPVVAAVTGIGVVVGALAAKFAKARDAVTDFDEALKGLDGKQTVFDGDRIEAMATRFEQLSSKIKLSADELQEVRDITQLLRQEFGDLQIGIFDGKLIDADKFKKQLQAARAGASQFAQSQAIALAESSLATRKLEGAGNPEILQRDNELAQMRADLERTKRIVADAAGDGGRPAATSTTAASGRGGPSIFESLLGAPGRGVAALSGAIGRIQLDVGSAILEAQRAAARHQIDVLDEGLALDEEVAREKIAGIKDQRQREIAALEFEKKQKIAALTKAGLASSENLEKLKALFAAQLANLQDTAAAVGVGPRSTFNSKLAPQVFGAGGQDTDKQQLAQLKKAVVILDGIKNNTFQKGKGGFLPVGNG